MIRWLWKIIVGNKPAPAPLPCNRECQWGEAQHRIMYDHEKTGVLDEWYVQSCQTCGVIRHHVVMKDGVLQ